ncbi:MAG: hypothetical protein DWQ05_18540 [Calditrichaeota bacterium]|nr:MAG: hypothetical protein DWQ05_18540 [Calditrichota bacterium]
MKTLIKMLVLFILPFTLLAQIPHITTPLDDMANPAVYRQGNNMYSPAQRALIQGEFIGFQGGIGTYGANGLFQREWAIHEDLHQAFDMNLYWIPRDEYGYWASRSSVTLARDNAMLIPIFWSVRKNVYRESLNSELIPYLEAGAGPLLGIRFPANYVFHESILKATTVISVGGFLGAGFNYAIGERGAGNMSVRYNILKFPERVGRRDDYSGFSIMFGYIAAFD